MTERRSIKERTWDEMTALWTCARGWQQERNSGHVVISLCDGARGGRGKKAYTGQRASQLNELNELLVNETRE